MPKPFVNLDDVVFTDVEDNGCYTSKRAQFSRTPLRYLALSNLSPIEVCEYPDSAKIGVHADDPGPGLHRVHRAEATVDYYDRERTDELPRGHA